MESSGAYVKQQLCSLNVGGLHITFCHPVYMHPLWKSLPCLSYCFSVSFLLALHYFLFRACRIRDHLLVCIKSPSTF